MFSDEFPDLRKDDQTKEELMNRHEQLSNTVWDIIQNRKDEAIEHIAQMTKGGWSDIEMRNVCRHMASLIEVEITKFETVYKLQMMAEPPIALDAEIFVKKAFERGSKPYDAKTQTSPVLNQMILNLFSGLDEIINKNPVVLQIIDDL